MTENAYTRRFLKDPPEQENREEHPKPSEYVPVDNSVEDVDKEES